MDASFIPVEVVPSKTPFGLDQLRRSYKTALSAEAAIAAAPAVGTADETFPNMFLMPISTPESAESATRIDLLYMGSLQGDEGDPTLPDQKHDTSSNVQSASSSRGVDGAVLNPALSVQYYAPTTELSFFTFGAPGTSAEVNDPTDDIVPITVTLGDNAYTPTGHLADLITNFFVRLIVATIESTELVPGQYWQNTARKIKTLSPYLQSIESGDYIFMIIQGVGYSVGNSLTITDGTYTAVVSVTAVSPTSGVIFTFSVTSNTFNYDTRGISPLYASGGSGSGAAFDNIHIP